jgi:hypothetical protein
MERWAFNLKRSVAVSLTIQGLNLAPLLPLQMMTDGCV